MKEVWFWCLILMCLPIRLPAHVFFTIMKFHNNEIHNNERTPTLPWALPWALPWTLPWALPWALPRALPCALLWTLPWALPWTLPWTLTWALLWTLPWALPWTLPWTLAWALPRTLPLGYVLYHLISKDFTRRTGMITLELHDTTSVDCVNTHSRNIILCALS